MNARTMPIITIDDAQLQHVVIRASAGSGKTHALSGRYLSLLAAGVEPHRILATTFTRAAAGEIRDRLLKRLASAAGGGADDDDVRKAQADLAQSLGVKSVRRSEALAMLVRMVRDLHTLQIRTLDSFFSTIVRSFSIELGLPPECSVIDENDDRALRHEAMRLLLDEGDPNALVELLRLLTRGDSDRGVTDTIDRTVLTLHELWREASPEAWRWMPEPGGLLSRTNLALAIETLRECAIPDDQRFAKARQGDVESALAGDWKSLIGKGLGRKVADEDPVYYNKGIDGALLKAYRPLVQHAKAELLHGVREQTLATQLLLGLFNGHYDRLKRRESVLTFTDLTHAMRGAAALGTLDDIGYRLDARIHHMLLDEFQDTSSPQWQSLRGMCEEMTAQQPPRRTFFCVGDVKQSIYGWRSASPEILERLSSTLPGVQERSLDRSYRSSPIVIDAVNEVFSSVPSNAALAGDDGHMAAAVAWHASFAPHDVADGLKDAPGYVEMRTIAPQPGDKASERLQQRLRAAADLACQLHRRDSRLRIALLTRRNSTVARLLFELGPAGRGVPVSGRGGGPLIDAPPVNAILDLLNLADHPDDTVSAFNVATSPLGVAIGFTEFNRDFERWRLARDVRRSLMLDGYQATIARWVSAIAAACDARECRRAAQLVELAGLHDAAAGGAGLRTQPFIDLVESKDVPDSQPAPIEVMTVHQAKGLEFDAVILPELDGALRGVGTPMVVFDRDDRTSAITRIARYANKETQALLPELAELSDRMLARTVRESLSVLYVAMTRARHGLYMIVDPPAENEKKWPATATGVLRGALCADGCEPNAVVWHHGDPEWIGRLDRQGAGRGIAAMITETGDSSPIIFAREPADAVSSDAAEAPSAARDRRLARTKASELRERLRLTNPEGRERGSVIHALFEHVEWIEDFKPDDDALMAIAEAVAPRRDVAWRRRQIDAFHGMLGKPAISAALSRSSVGGSAVCVLRELPFVRTTAGGIQSGSIDRLVLRLDAAGRANSATIIEFKTDSIVEGSAAAQAETHREQLQDYREVVATMFGLAEKAVAMQVLLVGAGAAIDL